MEYSVFISRFSPLHNGHKTIIDQMLCENFKNKCLILIGSCNKLSEDTPFTYSERKSFITNVFGDECKISGIPDFSHIDQSGKLWMEYLEDLIELILKTDISNCTFYGGSENDVWWCNKFGFNSKIIDRDQLKISGTMIREKIKNKEDISEFVPKEVYDLDWFKFKYGIYTKEMQDELQKMMVLDCSKKIFD